MISDDVVVSIDAMGGDGGSEMVVRAVASLTASVRAKFLLFGDRDVLDPLVEKYFAGLPLPEVRDVKTSISADDKPSVMLRKGRDSSLGKAIEAVRDGQADVVVSAGNTGVYVALATLILDTLNGIKRPAIATQLPTVNGSCIALDLGANTDCSSERLVQFAIMGESLASSYTSSNAPKVALLNIGSEATKGNKVIQETSKLLSDGIVKNYVGFIEGDGIWMGEADVIVTDGFSGNIALKSAEGAAKLLIKHFKSAFLEGGFLMKVAGFLLKKRLKKALSCFDPRAFNGALLMGLNFPAVKSHGGTDYIGFANAIKFAIKVCVDDVINKTKKHSVFSANNEN